MARANVPLLSFNRGLLSPKALARVDLDRTKLSAEVMTNWLPKTQGAMRIRPGTKHLGSSLNDTGAEWIEFVAATDDTALVELTHQKMRIWIDDALLTRPSISTRVTLSDTGWSNASTGGALATPVSDLIPTMTGATTNGVTITASSQNTGGDVDGDAWHVGDNASNVVWQDTGLGEPSRLPSWVQFDFGTADTGSWPAVYSYSVQASNVSAWLNKSPSTWQLQRSTNGSVWVTEDTQGSETGWAVSEKRTYSVPGGDTGTVERYRYWRFNVTAVDGGNKDLVVGELELFPQSTAQQARRSSGSATLNATSIGALARLRKRVIVDTGDYNEEHSLVITIDRGPVTLRVGSTSGDDDYVEETALGTGYHNIAFTPTGNFHITLQSESLTDRIVSSLEIGDTGVVQVPTFIDAADLSNVRYDQSADVVYVDCNDVAPHKIERRGTGHSWSFVKYRPDNGPFLSAASSSAKLSVSHFYGNTKLNSDIPFFKPGHVGSLVRLFHQGQSGIWPLGAADAATDAVQVTGISDTGTATATSERRIVFSVTGTWSGRITLERSFDGSDIGFKPISGNLGAASDTGTFTRTIDDPDDNVDVWYRARIADTGASGNAYTSGAALVSVIYGGGGVNGIGRVTGYTSNTECNIEVLRNFSDTGPTDVWQEGAWSSVKRFPSAVALNGGRLSHAGGANLWASVSDDYENFDDETEGDAAPLNKTLGSGPVDNVLYLISLLRLIIGTSGAEIAVRSSSLDEPLTPTNSSARTFSTQGSANIRALKMDTKGIVVQRSGKRVFMIGFGENGDALGDYDTHELTMLVPDLLSAGVVSTAIQRQPDTRIHCVLGNGKVAILTYEPQEQVICWSMWETDGSVEKAMVLPGTGEDKVYYHVNRTINGVTKRFLERWAMEAESEGDSGLSWIADCARSYTDTGRSAALVDIATHLVGEAVVVWSDDTGSIPGVDRSPDVNGVQTTYTVDTGGDVTLTVPVHHAVAGLPFSADWKSTKLAYAAEAGTALAQMKRTDKIGFALYKTHNNGLFFGNDTGNLDALPRVSDEGAQVDADKIFAALDMFAMPFPGLWNPDSRIHLRGKAPRPVTVLAAIPTVATNEKV